MIGRQGAIVVDPGLDHPPASPAAVESAWPLLATRGAGRAPLSGLWLGASGPVAKEWAELATRLQPDVVVGAAVAAAWPHPWVQRGAVARVSTDGPVAKQLGPVTAQGADFVLIGAASAADDVTALVRQVVAWGDPEDPARVPWFWEAASLDEARAAGGAGAVRVALTAPDADLVERCDRLTGLSWQSAAMRRYTLTALRPGRAGAAAVSGWDAPTSLPPLGPAGRTRRAAKSVPARKGSGSAAPLDAQPGQLDQAGSAD